MTWSEQWSYKVDGGIELNDGVNFNTQIPQVDDVPDWDVKDVPIDGTYAAFIRADPTSGVYTVMVQMFPCAWAVYNSRMATLDGIFSRGAAHVLAFQARGMPAAKSVTFYVRGRVVDPKLRRVVFNCHVLLPVPA